MNFCISLFGRCIFTIYDHYIFRIRFQENDDINYQNIFEVEYISNNNIDQLAGLDFSIDRMKKYLKYQPNKMKGLLFLDEKREIIGYYWTAFQGANETQYRVRNAKAYNFDLCVAPNFRGQGYAKYIMSYMGRYVLRPEGIHEAYSVVRTNNTASIIAHKKFGAEIVGRKKFIRILRVNIPYHKI